MKWITTIIAILMLAIPAMAQELPDPGITPDSPFYFLDRMFSGFKSPNALADERAAEVVAMAQKGHAKGLQIAMEQYEKAMQKREAQAEADPDKAEEVAAQTSNHLIVLARVRAQVPEAALQGIDNAIARSASGRERSLEALSRQKPERATIVAQETLQRVIVNAPEQAQQGLQRAMVAVARRGPEERMPVEIAQQVARAPDIETGRMPAETGPAMPIETGPREPARGPNLETLSRTRKY